MKLKNKITISICIIVVFSLVIMCISIYTKSASILNDEFDDFSEIQILRAQEKIDLLVDKVRLETVAMSREQNTYDFFSGRHNTRTTNDYFTKTMEQMNLASESGYYKDLFLVDLKGVIVASTMPNAMYVDLSERSYIQESLNNQSTATSDILNALTDGANIVNSTHPIYDTEGNMLGLFGIAVRAENFVYFIKDYKIGEHGYFAIIDSNGYILSHKDPAVIGQPAAKALPGFEEIRDSQLDHLYKSNTPDYTYSYKKMDGNDWILFTAMPKSELAAKSMSLLYYVILYGAIISGCAIFISIYFSNKISSPITSINNYIKRAANSNYLMENAIGETVVNVRKNFLAEGQDIPQDTDMNNFMNTLKDKLERKTPYFDRDAFELIKKAQALTDSLEMKSYLTSKFLSTLSHDIRTSLTLIKGYSKGLMSGLIEDEETKAKFIQEIYSSANTLEQISFDVLDSTYEAQNNRQVKKEEVPAEEFCQYLFNTAHDYIENSDRIFTGSCNIKGGTLFIAKVKIIRVWQNMLSNAVKYSDTYSEVSVHIVSENNCILFKVADKGIGIKESDRNYIFEMFFKSDLSPKNSYGLGLFVSKLILKSHDSAMMFDSAEGKGSSFWFCLTLL